MYKQELKFCNTGQTAKATNCLDSEENLSCPPFIFDLRKRKIYKDGQLKVVTSIEYRLALHFFTHQKVLITRDHLLEQVWNTSTDVRTRTIDVHISTLRKKLSLNSTGWRIKTVYGEGYILQFMNPDN